MGAAQLAPSKRLPTAKFQYFILKVYVERLVDLEMFPNVIAWRGSCKECRFPKGYLSSFKDLVSAVNLGVNMSTSD
jgi:hypothetical protein